MKKSCKKGTNLSKEELQIISSYRTKLEFNIRVNSDKRYKQTYTMFENFLNNLKALIDTCFEKYTTSLEDLNTLTEITSTSQLDDIIEALSLVNGADTICSKMTTEFLKKMHQKQCILVQQFSQMFSNKHIGTRIECKIDDILAKAEKKLIKSLIVETDDILLLILEELDEYRNFYLNNLNFHLNDILEKKTISLPNVNKLEIIRTSSEEDILSIVLPNYVVTVEAFCLQQTLDIANIDSSSREELNTELPKNIIFESKNNRVPLYTVLSDSSKFKLQTSGDSFEFKAQNKKLPLQNKKDLINQVTNKGFSLVRQTGDHGIFKNAMNETVVVPLGREVGKGLQRKIFKDINSIG